MVERDRTISVANFAPVGVVVAVMQTSNKFSLSFTVAIVGIEKDAAVQKI